jgi:hypothetical protein
MHKSLIGLFLLFAILFVPQCITVPAMYETAEAKEEKRAGVSAQYGRGNYSVSFCENTTRYDYKYGGLRVDYANVKKTGKLLEAGYELGASVNGFDETNVETNAHRRAIMLQIDGRLTGKIVTPTSPVRLGLKAAPGLLLHGGISHRAGKYESGGGISMLSYVSFLLGVGNPEFLTVAYHYYHYEYLNIII